jgi:hypothetical protein
MSDIITDSAAVCPWKLSAVRNDNYEGLLSLQIIVTQRVHNSDTTSFFEPPEITSTGTEGNVYLWNCKSDFNSDSVSAALCYGEW